MNGLVPFFGMNKYINYCFEIMQIIHNPLTFIIEIKSFVSCRNFLPVNQQLILK
jgi:hypothetical protein